jgi:hypothetical protein
VQLLLANLKLALDPETEFAQKNADVAAPDSEVCFGRVHTWRPTKMDVCLTCAEAGTNTRVQPTHGAHHSLTKDICLSPTQSAVTSC